MFNNHRALKYCVSALIILQANFITHASENASLRGLFALGGLAVTGGVTKMLSGNKFIDRHYDKTGINSGEIATVTGLMGGLFSLGNAIPEANMYGWLVPVLYGSYKVANSNFLNHYFFSNIPNVGEHIAGREILEARNVIKSSDSPFYNMRLLCILNMIKKSGLDTASKKDYKDLFDSFTQEIQKMMTKDEWEAFFIDSAVGTQLCQKYEMFYRKEKPFEITGDTLAKLSFATAAVTLCIYEPTKILLRKTFDYPSCFINLSGRYIDKMTTLIH